MANEYLPIGISLQKRIALVVGGGAVALRKVDTLLDYEADITVIAPEPVEKIRYYAEKNRIHLETRAYQSPEVDRYGLVVSASDDRAVNRQVSEDARKAGIPVNVVDDPELCDFIFPAVTKRNYLTVAISTDGKAPFLSRYLRLVLDDIFPDRWRKIAGYAAEFRNMVQRDGPKGHEDRMQCLDRFLRADWKSMLKDKSHDEIRQEMTVWLTEDGSSPPPDNE